MTNPHGSPTMSHILSELGDRVRAHLGVKYGDADRFPIGGNPAKLKNVHYIKSWSQAGITACSQLERGRVTGEKDTKTVLRSDEEDLIKVRLQFTTVNSAAAKGWTNAVTAVAAFNNWRTGSGYLSWETFTRLQAPITAHANKVTTAQVTIKKYTDCSNKAKSIAVTERNKHRGPDKQVGKVIAGMVDSDSNESWLGTSAAKKGTHPVMDELLSNVNKIEEWDIDNCGEVDAMIKYLNARNIKNVGDIPSGALFSHAETWDEDQRKWKARAACSNCGQWLKRIGAHCA